jgi:hypothetical protein
MKLLLLVISAVKNIYRNDDICETRSQTKVVFKILFFVSKYKSLNVEKLIHEYLMKRLSINFSLIK